MISVFIVVLILYVFPLEFNKNLLNITKFRTQLTLDIVCI